MSAHRRFFNLTRNCHVDAGQVLARIESHVAAWVERGKTYRELSLPEVLALRAAQRETAPPLPYRGVSNELPGIIFQPPARDRYKFRDRYPLLRQAAEILGQYA